MSNYLREALRPTTQSEPFDERQVPNSAGGFAYATSPLDRLRRFLILGTEGGSYYASQRKLTGEQVDNLRQLVKEAGPEVVRVIREVSEGGLAPKNDPALLALAIASAEGDEATRTAAFEALPSVARIGTHLFHWLAFRDELAGWGRGARRAVARWYTEKKPEALAYQLVKYRQRDGWTHRDALRLSHPGTPASFPDAHRVLYNFACGRISTGRPSRDPSTELRLMEGFLQAQEAASPAQSADIIRYFKGLPREAIKTEHLTSSEVWEALLEDMPIAAMIRNLANMTRAGVIAPMSQGTRTVAERLGGADRLRKGRIHPIQVLSALITYQSGRGARGGGEWMPVAEVVDALDGAFYAAFGAVEPANRRTLLALDVSGSMTFGEIAGVPGLTPRLGSAAMALVTAATEPLVHICAFSTQMIPISISPRQRLEDAVGAVSNLPFGGTDCAQPMLYALANRIEVDTFVVYTDSETWAGPVHPVQALRDYRQATGIDAKLIVAGMVSNDFTIADPDDPGMLDVVGFDTSAPSLMAAFSRGDI